MMWLLVLLPSTVEGGVERRGKTRKETRKLQCSPVMSCHGAGPGMGFSVPIMGMGVGVD